MMAGSAAIALAYLLGAIPFGLLIYRIIRGGDLRAVGRGNIGATNVSRAGGWALGLLTLALDAGKGAAAVAIAGRLLPGEPSLCAAAALAAVTGHCFPIFLRFRGGKGVATGCGAFTLLYPAAMGVAVIVFVLTVATTRMVSGGSILAALAFPIASGCLGAGAAATSLATIAGLVIVVRHQENIRRILRGAERRLGADGGPVNKEEL